MDQGVPHRPRVSRETRLLLTTAFVAIAALWVLARVRFPDPPAAPVPVQPLLTQLAPRPTFDDLAGEISQLQRRLQPLLTAYEIPSPAGTQPAGDAPLRPALRVRTNAAVVLLDVEPEAGVTDVRDSVIGMDPASRLALVQVPPLSAPQPVPWASSDAPQERYLIASDASIAGLSLRPVFVGSLIAVASPVWPDLIWVVPGPTDLSAGTFVFTSDGRLTGLVVDHAGQRAIVPGDVLLAEVDRLLVSGVAPPGRLGIEVQPLTSAVAKATGATSGVVVTWVDPAGPSTGAVGAGDVLESATGEVLLSPLYWESRVARLAAGDSISVRVRRGGESTEVVLVAAPVPEPLATPALGLTLRPVPGTGAAVTRVDAGSTADRAGVQVGDIITRIADVTAPTPAAIRATFAAAIEGDALLLAITRGDAHQVTALEK